MVRPWKFPEQTMISAWWCGIFLTAQAHLRASLRAVSTASAPEFINRDISYPVSSESSL